MKSAYPQLWNELLPLVEKWKPTLDRIKTVDQQAGMLAGGLDNYGLGRRLTGEASQRIRNQLESFSAQDRTPSAAATGALESYQKPRSTILYNVDIDGKPMSFLEGDRVYATLSDDQINSLPKTAREQAEHIRGVIKAYDAQQLPDKDPGRHLSILEINDRVRRGDMWHITGGAWDGSFFELDPAVAIAERARQSENNQLRSMFQDVAKQYGLPIAETPIRKVAATTGAQGATFETLSGVKGRFYRDGNKNWLDVNGQRYRPINADGVKPELWDPIRAAIKQDNIAAWFPEEIADRIESLTSMVKNEDDANVLVRGLDSMSRAWKMLTLSHPSWVINDTIGNVVMAANMGVSPAELFKHAKAALQTTLAHARGDSDRLSRPIAKLRDIEFTGLDLIQDGVQGGGSPREAMLQALADGSYLTPHMHDLISRSAVKNPGQHFQGLWQEASTAARDAATASLQQSALRSTPGVHKALAGKNLLISEIAERRIWQPWIKLNGIANDWVRTAAMMALIDKGYDPAAAARQVSTSMLDMRDLTSTESKLRRIVPFYVWIKNSGILGVRSLVENPKLFTTAPHLKRAIEESINGDDRIPEHQRPSWMRDQMLIQIGRSPNDRYGVTIGNMLPTESAAYFATLLGTPALGWQAAQDTAAYITNTTNPLIRAPLELGAGREFFTGRTISGSGTGDLTIPEYALGFVRPFREFGVGNVRTGPVQSAFARSPAEGIARLTVGGRVQPFGEERRLFNLKREFTAKLDTARRRIRLAEREQNQEQSLNARVQLMHLFNQMQQKGLGDDIPKWARAQLQQLAQPV